MIENRMVYRAGDNGPAVAEIRAKLAQVGLPTGAGAPVDVFDQELDRAVRAFQQRRGLTADGLVGPATYRVLDEARWRLGDRLLTYVAGRPMVGDDVIALQRRLTELGFDVGVVDGYFGPATRSGLRDFQRNIGLPTDGTCGPATLKLLARLAPMVTGGHPESLRANEELRAAGPALSGKVVLVDPGHGGPDPGVVGHGLTEAAVAEDLAARVEGRLAATGVQVLLTRGPGLAAALDDIARAQFANETGADLVVSLHADAGDNPAACGVASYYYGHDDHGPASVIGEHFASLVQREIVARTDLVDLHSHPKTWDLLRRTRMAAVRVEVGYLSNRGDAARLADPAFRDVIAEAIVVAVQRLYLPEGEDATTGNLRLADLTAAAATSGD
jgi:N-acetylmuramoyl-L-alanine amidase